MIAEPCPPARSYTGVQLILAATLVLAACPSRERPRSEQQPAKAEVAERPSEPAPEPSIPAGPAFVELGDRRILALDDEGWRTVHAGPLRQIFVGPAGRLHLHDGRGVHRLEGDAFTTVLDFATPGMADFDEIDVGPKGQLWLLDHEGAELLAIGEGGSEQRWRGPGEAPADVDELPWLEAEALRGMAVDGAGRAWLVLDPLELHVREPGEGWTRVDPVELGGAGATILDWGVASSGAFLLLSDRELLVFAGVRVRGRRSLPAPASARAMASNGVGEILIVGADCRLRVWALASLADARPPVAVPGCGALRPSAFDERGRTWLVDEPAALLVVEADGTRVPIDLREVASDELVLEDVDVIAGGPALLRAPTRDELEPRP